LSIKRDASTENLAYLTSKQALADLAAFRNFIHTSYGLSDSNRWIAFGGSYPGALAAWFRLKYPNLVYAAVSSSAPVKAIVDFSDYNVIVGQSLGTYSSECTKEISDATASIQSYTQSGSSGYSTLQNVFK
jgi:serine protease 16